MSVFAKSDDKQSLETGPQFTPRFGPDGLIPCIAQDTDTGEVVMFAFMNETSLAKSLQTGEAWYWSRSRSELWHKGATSGSVQRIVEMKTDCDQDVILIRVHTRGNGNNCHRDVKSCFYRTVSPNAETPEASTLHFDE